MVKQWEQDGLRKGTGAHRWVFLCRLLALANTCGPAPAPPRRGVRPPLREKHRLNERNHLDQHIFFLGHL
jgi:hypothetical protein